MCSDEVSKKDTWQLHMNTAEGPHQVTICGECAKELDKIKEEAETWLEK